MAKKSANAVDLYIADFPKETQQKLQQLREIILEAAPGAEEKLSYKMPYYSYHGRLVYFAGYKHHIGLYPMASGITKFKKEISGYKNAKGSVQFPLDEPLPVKLIRKMMVFRAKENLKKESCISKM
ncbi:MAG: hypothetical protein JWP12_1497 [Bacteroidetes bacterium]|nr:hypothetical protein [Bacteroidota bacterium]